MRTALVGSVLLLGACGGGGGGDDMGPGDPDAAAVDGDTPDGAPDAAPDAAAGCGTSTPPLAEITGTEGIAIAPDGTIYYSQPGHVGRWVPGAPAPEDDWVALAGTSTVWGMALDGPTLYVATPASGGAGIVWRIDTAAASPAAEMHYPSAGRPNGLTVGPDGAVYYGDFVASGHVYRVDSSGNRTTVTDAPLALPNGVLFDADGTLLVALYQAGDVVRLTLGEDHTETARAFAVEDTGASIDGLARDVDGRYYLTDNGGGEVLRYDAAFRDPETLLPNVGAAANLAFGRGALPCTDLYVTSSGALRRIDAGAAGWP